MAEVDLDRLASAYDHRPELGIESRIAAAAAAAGLERGDVVVDVGGGRGRHAERFVSGWGSRAVVVDPSRSMAKAASAHGVPAVVARGEELPLRGGVAALVYFHLSIHHGDWRRMLGEAWRVVRPGGTVHVWTMDPDYHRRSFLARWFPRVGEVDAGRFPARDDLMAEVSALGGTPAGSDEVEMVERTAGEWARAVRAGFVSTLHLLTGDEIEAGLARFAAAHPDPAESVRYQLEFTSVWSRRPSVES